MARVPLPLNHSGKNPNTDRPPLGDKKLRARPGDALRKLEDPAAQGERKLDEWRRLVLLGTCQKKLMAEDPEYRDLRSLAGIDVSEPPAVSLCRVLKKIRRVVCVRSKLRPILAARAVMGGRGEEKRQTC